MGGGGGWRREITQAGAPKTRWVRSKAKREARIALAPVTILFRAQRELYSGVGGTRVGLGPGLN